LDIARFFARQECQQSGGRGAIICKSISLFQLKAFTVDEEMIDFPVLIDIRKGVDYGHISDQWEESAATWEDSLRIFEAVVYNAFMPVVRADVMR
jgi:hypothetical protein